MKQGMIDTRLFTDENGKIQARKLGACIIKDYTITRIKPSKNATRGDIQASPLYGYNPKYGIYEGLTTHNSSPLDAIIYNAVGELEISSSKMNDTIRYIKANAPTLDYISSNIIAFDNTLYDVANNKILTKSPDIVTTTRIAGVVYDPSQTESKILDEFMYTLFGGHDDDADMMRFIYECIGYCLVNNTFAQKFFILYGEGGNGKSTFLEVLQNLLTENNISAISLHDFSDSKFRIVGIVGKLANLGDDIEHKAVLNTAIIKKIVTGDNIIVERKGYDPYNYQPHTKLFFSCDKIPTIMDTAKGIQDRLIIIPMINRIRDTELASPTIVADIVESGGLTVLLNRAIDGLNRLKERGKFIIPPRVVELTRAYNEENNHIALFLKDIEEGEVSCIANTSYMALEFAPLKNVRDVTSKELYQIYSQWAKDAGYRPRALHNFGQEMRKLGYEIKPVRGIAKGDNKQYKAWVCVT